MSKDPCNQNFYFHTFDCSSDLTLCLSKGNYQEYERVQMHFILLENQTRRIILVKLIMTWASVPLSTQWPFILVQDLCKSQKMLLCITLSLIMESTDCTALKALKDLVL